MISLWACYPGDWYAFSQVLDTYAVRSVLLGQAPSADFDVQYVDRPEIRACVLRAHGDCDAMMACLGLERPTLLSEEECAATDRHCEGDVRVQCVEGRYLFRQDLRALGTTCESLPRESCDWVGRRCLDSSTFVTCTDGLFGYPRVCEPGFACSEEPTSWACVPAGPSCEQSHCDGDLAVSCSPVNDERSAFRDATRIDCASGGMRCAETDVLGEVLPQCVATLDECEPGPATCDGTALTYCAPDGSVRRYDCVEHGFARCDGERSWGALCAPEVPWT